MDIPVGTTLAFPVAAANTGPTTLALNSDSPSPLTSGSGPLQGGELNAGDWVLTAWAGLDWLLVAKEDGAFPMAPGTGGNQPFLLGQLQNGSMNPNLSSVMAAEITGGTLLAEQVYMANASLPGELVNFSQLISGAAGSSSVVDWTNFTLDAPLGVGQTAYYAPTSRLNSVPLHISCADNQIYEMDIYQLPPYSNFITEYGSDLSLSPNNTSYSSSFQGTALENSAGNQGQFYKPSSSTPAYGMDANLFSASTFFVDDIAGSAIPPYQRNIKLYTGKLNGAAKVLYSIGGGGNTPSASGATPTTGTNITGLVWDDTTTPYVSLGTLSADGTSTFTWVIFVRRIF